MGHKYSDNCTCEKCTAAWDKALFAAIDRGEAKKKKLNEKSKSQTKKEENKNGAVRSRKR